MRIRIQEVKKPVENALNKWQKHKVDYKKCIFKFKIYIIKSNSTLKTLKKRFLSAARGLTKTGEINGGGVNLVQDE